MSNAARIKYTRYSVNVGTRSGVTYKSDFYVAEFQRFDNGESASAPTVLATLEADQWNNGLRRWHIRFADGTPDDYIDSLSDAKQEIERRVQAALNSVFDAMGATTARMLYAVATTHPLTQK